MLWLSFYINNYGPGLTPKKRNLKVFLLILGMNIRIEVKHISLLVKLSLLLLFIFIPDLLCFYLVKLDGSVSR